MTERYTDGWQIDGHTMTVRMDSEGLFWEIECPVPRLVSLAGKTREQAPLCRRAVDEEGLPISKEPYHECLVIEHIRAEHSAGGRVDACWLEDYLAVDGLPNREFIIDGPRGMAYRWSNIEKYPELRPTLWVLWDRKDGIGVEDDGL